MTASSIGNRAFQSGVRSDDQNKNTYEGSEIDNYLENDWYNSLSSTMKGAIQATNIKQVSYKSCEDPDSKQETGYNGQVYNIISRHAFLPSVSEIGKIVDLKNSDKVEAFLNGTDIWTRDALNGNSTYVIPLITYYVSGLGNFHAEETCGVRPAFVIDLSQVNYSVVK